MLAITTDPENNFSNQSPRGRNCSCRECCNLTDTQHSYETPGERVASQCEQCMRDAQASAMASWPRDLHGVGAAARDCIENGRRVGSTPAAARLSAASLCSRVPPAPESTPFLYTACRQVVYVAGASYCIDRYHGGQLLCRYSTGTIMRDVRPHRPNMAARDRTGPSIGAPDPGNHNKSSH